MSVKHDQEVAAVYFQFSDRPFATHIRLDSGRGYDLDAEGDLIGIEILLPAKGDRAALRRLPVSRRSVDLVGLPKALEIGRWLLDAGYTTRGQFYAATHDPLVSEQIELTFIDGRHSAED